ncbi:hygromycin-B 4-O-kinase [Mucilaginibacter lappiensis]|nr:hygromycin-B 4-O-kinase [Mucilaginibacter lappiensis]
MHIGINSLHVFLRKQFTGISDVKHIADGWWSQVFSFKTDEGSRVIRISKHLTDFRKDIFAYTHFNSAQIPVPEIIAAGKYDTQFFYCVSKYVDGIPSDQIIDAQGSKPDLLLTQTIVCQLSAIHRLNTGNLKGWGYTNENGDGIFGSWQEYLLAIHNGKYTIAWQELAKTTWLNGELFARLTERMRTYFPYLPKEKHVLHGDYGYDNLLLTADHKIAAVIDWAEMLLGDPMYDLIHMNEPWAESAQLNYMDIWKQDIKNDPKALIHFEQRLQCYTIHYTLFHLHIHTIRGEREDYEYIEHWANQNL